MPEIEEGLEIRYTTDIHAVRKVEELRLKI